MANLALALEPQPAPPDWLLKTDVLAEIERGLNSITHRERWKYTKPQPVIDLLPSSSAMPEMDLSLPGLHYELIERTSLTPPIDLNVESAPEAAAAMCYQPQVCVLHITSTLEKPIEITHTGSSLPIVIRVAPNVEMSINEFYRSDSNQHQTLWLELNQGSQVRHSRNAFSQGVHWQFLSARLARDARYTLNNHVAGAELRRQDIQIACTGPGAHAEITSAAFIASNTHLDQQITLEHQSDHSSSKQAFHNVVGDNAKVTFNGRIHIHKSCPGVDAQLTNKNLTVGERATINSKPELEIYTDDVKCAHGTTIGRLDDDHIFYCASRGIAPEQAKTLLARAFLNECTQGDLADHAVNSFDAMSGWLDA